MESLTKSDIIFINQKTIKRHRGKTSTQPKSSNQILLEFVLDVAKAQVSLEECQE